jgi:hypothetical protein
MKQDIKVLKAYGLFYDRESKKLTKTGAAVEGCES